MRTRAAFTIVGLVAATVFLWAPGTKLSGNQPPGAASNIYSCGTLSASGKYVVQNDLTATSGDCLDIAASNILVDLNGFTLTGDGTGSGSGGQLRLLDRKAAWPLRGRCTASWWPGR